MASRYILSVAVGTAVAVSLTGCRLGDSGGPKSTAPVRLSALDVLNQTSQRTNKVRSYRVRTSISSAASGRSVKMTGHGDVRLGSRLAQRWTVPTMTLSGRSAGGFQEIVLGDFLYLKPPANARSTGDKPWIRLSLRQLSAKSGMDYTSELSEQSDPSATVEMLTATKDVRELGHETVGGVATTHYQGTYSMTDALAKLAKHRASATRYYRQMGLDKMAFNLWVDGRRLPRKVTLATPAGSKISMAVTTLYSGFDVPVSISAPPRTQVTDGNRLLGGRVPGVPA